jgi:UDP-N-acetylmuramate dehydrogenase
LPSDEVGLQPQRGVSLAPLTTLAVGGGAAWFVRATSVADIAAAHRWAEERMVPLFVLGGGSNLVIADRGFDGLVVQVGIAGTRFEPAHGETLLTAGAGEPWDPLVEAAVARGLAGLESLSGIPGTVGGTPIQNVGAYGQEVSESIAWVRVYDRVASDARQLAAGECGFSYRMSRFKGVDAGRFVVCEVAFRLQPRQPSPNYPDILAYLGHAGMTTPSLADVRAAVLSVRRRKGMVVDAADPDTRSVGSFFMNPIVAAADRERVSRAAGAEAPGFNLPDGRIKLPAAWLIERAGFARGHIDGAVGISTKHTLALVNRGGATACDVLRVARRIKRTVVDRFGVWLRPEPVFVGFGHDPDVDYLQKTDG